VLETIAAQRDQSLAGLLAVVDAERRPDQPLASALRVFALDPYRGDCANPQCRM
jgi:predicted DNA-binding ribbon-helix-helix protein